MLGVFSVSVLAVAVLLLLYWLYRKVWVSFQVFKEMGVDGPKPEVFFGNSRQRERLGWQEFLHSVTRQYGSIAGFYQGTIPHLLVSDLDMLKHILIKEFDYFTDKPWFPDVLRPQANSPPGLTESRGSEWRSSRHTLSPTFSAAKMKMMVPLIESSATGLIKNINNIAQSGKTGNVFKLFCSFTMEVVMRTAFGREVDIQGGENNQLTQAVEAFFQGSKEGETTSFRYIYPITSHLPHAIVEPVIRFAVHRVMTLGKTIRTLGEAAQGFIEERRQNGHKGKYKDLLQLMIDASVEGDNGITKLSNEQIMAHSVTFLLAGYETTANTLTYTAYLLALHPAVQEKLQREIDSYIEDNPGTGLYEASQEISYLDMVLLESLRMYSPIQFLQRCCVKSTTVNGLTVPEGVCVMVPVDVVHKNPQYWEEPDQFKPERFTAEEKAKRPQLCYLPFGHGPRNCIGMRFALLEAKIALIEMLRKYSFVRAPDTEVPLETVVGIAMAPKNGVFLKVVPRE